MGARSGGGGGMSNLGSKQINRGVTERGYSAKLAKQVLTAEMQIKTKPVEHAYVFDKNGKIKYNTVGGKHSAYIPTKYIQDSIITHNHPKEDKGRIRADYGGSLSSGDIKAVIEGNGKEIRAVTEKYTFSLERPKNGWNKTALAAKRRYNAIEKQLYKKASEYYYNYKGDKKAAWRRYQSLESHLIMKQLAKEFGWSYTWKKNK